MLKCPTNSPVSKCETRSPARRTSLFEPGHRCLCAGKPSSGLLKQFTESVEEQAWISDPWYRRVTRRSRNAARPRPRLGAGRRYRKSILSSSLSRVDCWRVSSAFCVKRKWIVLACLATIFSLVAIASLRMTKVYEASGTIAINKPDNTLNFQNSATFSLDYYDPSELETEVKILQSDRSGPGGHSRAESGPAPGVWRRASRNPRPPSTLRPTLCRSIRQRRPPWSADSRATCGSLSSQNSRIIEVHYRSADPQMAANVVNTLMQTYVEDNRKARFESTMQASDWLQKQLVDLQMKVETSQEKLVRYQKEHEILGIDEKQNIITAKLDELNKELTVRRKRAHGQRSSFTDLVEIRRSGCHRRERGQPRHGQGCNRLRCCWSTLRSKQADSKIQVADLNTQFGPSYPKLAQLNNQLKEIDAQIQSEMKKIATKVRGQYTDRSSS